MNRVVVTGMGCVTALGSDWDTVFYNLRQGKAGISQIAEWEQVRGMRTRLAGRIEGFTTPDYYPRKKTRSMGRVALLGTRATELAIADAGINDPSYLCTGDVGVAYGSSTGSPTALTHFAPLRFDNLMKGISASSYLQMMPHTCAANIALFFGVSGRIIPTCSACTSGSQAIGFAYESIKHGYQRMMLAGGAEELCVTIVAVFDSMYATSVQNDSPQTSVKPFDQQRAGLVISEGAATLVLEELSSAQKRNAHIYAEIIGFGTNCDGMHITNPSPERMQQAMRLALADAKLSPDKIGYINAHATATENGDIAEAAATNLVFGSNTPISSLKGYFGHSLGACGSLEACLTILMMNKGWFAPTLNLKEIDPRCAQLQHIIGAGLEQKVDYAISNSFAFGGTNTAIIFKGI